VIPGITSDLKSSKIRSIGSPASGGVSGSFAAISPGAVCARTGNSSTVSM